MSHKNLILPVFVLALLVAAGCVKIGPDFKRPDLGITPPVTFQHDGSPGSKETLEDSWWRAYGNPELNSLVREALKRNWDIRKAAARVSELRSQLIRTRADRFPSLNLQAQAQHQRRTTSIPVTVLKGGTFELQSRQEKTSSDVFGLSLPASYELDLWGRLARAEEGARSSILAAVENQRTVAQSIVAETISLYLSTETTERRIQILEKSIDNYRQSVKLVEFRYNRGLASILDLRQARRVLAQSEASLPSLNQELGTAQQKMAVLLGRYPRTRPPRKHSKDYFKNLAPVPPGLPSSLLLRRPDLRAAEGRLKTLNAQIGEARANRFPHITLTGSYGYSSDALNHLLRPESELWSLAAGLVQPLFDAARLKAVEEGARARYRQGMADYAKAVLNAFSEVENALLVRQEQLKRRKLVLMLIEEARATQKVAEGRYRRGLTGYITVLDAQQSRFQAEETLVLVELAILTNRVSLYRSLGGGWEKGLTG